MPCCMLVYSCRLQVVTASYMYGLFLGLSICVPAVLAIGFIAFTFTLGFSNGVHAVCIDTLTKS